MGSPVNIIGKSSGKNYIINGGCQVAQRGSVAVANNTFKYGGCDRFAVGPFLTSVSAGNIVQQALSETVSGFAQCLFGLTSTGAGTVQFYTRLEGSTVRRLNGKKVNVSVLVFQNTGTTLTANVQFAKATALDNFTGTTNLTNPSFSVPSGVATRLSFTYTLGASDATNGLEIRPFFTLAGAVTTKDFYVGDWCLEEGTVFTGIEKREYQAELALCQRFYEKYTGVAGFAFDNNVSTTQGGFYWHFKTQKRVAPIGSTGPTVVSNSRYYGPSGLRGINSITPGNTGIDGATFSAVLASAAVQFEGGGIMIISSGAGDYIAADAEL